MKFLTADHAATDRSESGPKQTPQGALRWTFSTSPHDPAWDAFVDRNTYGHYEQFTHWGRVKSHYGWRIARLTAEQDGQMAAGFQVLERQLGPFARIGYICRGPVGEFDQAELIQAVAAQVNLLGSKRYAYLVIDPPYHGEQLELALRQYGFTTHDGSLPPSNSFDTTVLIDLAQEPDAIFKRIGASKRNKLRQSFRTDLRMRKGTAADVPLFQNLMWQLCTLRGSRPNPPQKDFFEKVWAEFPEGKVQLYILENSSKAVGAIFAFQCGQWLRCWKVGSSREDREKHPNERMWWEAIQDAREQGLRWFDFVWVDRDTARRLKSGEKASTEWRPESMTAFKMEFGGEVLHLPPQLIKIYNPLIRFMWRHNLHQIKSAVRTVTRLRSRGKGHSL